MLTTLYNAQCPTYKLVTHHTFRMMTDMDNIHARKLLACEPYIQRYTSSHISNTERTTRKITAHILQYRFICRDEHEAYLTHSKLLGAYIKRTCKQEERVIYTCICTRGQIVVLTQSNILTIISGTKHIGANRMASYKTM
jgi:hypothetical protein